MPIDRERIAQMEKALEEARRELLREDGQRYQILVREISAEEKERILESLTVRSERVLFGLEAPDPTRRGAGERAGKSGGDMECPVCGKTGFTKRGLGLHMVRLHKEEKAGKP